MLSRIDLKPGSFTLIYLLPNDPYKQRGSVKTETVDLSEIIAFSQEMLRNQLDDICQNLTN